MVRAPNPGVDAMCELSLLLVLSFAAPRTFSQGTPVSPLLKNQATNFQIPIRPGTHGRVSTEFLRTLQFSNLHVTYIP